MGLTIRAIGNGLMAVFASLLLTASWAALAKPSATPDLPEELTQSDWQSIRGAWQAGRHTVAESVDQPGTWQARNPGQLWPTLFDGRGFVAQPDHG